jgi:hypothetical protein
MYRCRLLPPALLLLAVGLLLPAGEAPAQPQPPAPRPAGLAAPDRAQVLDTMKRATVFMVERVSTAGG